MRNLFFLITMIFFCSSSVWAEFWRVYSVNPAGEVRDSHWEIKRDGGRVRYFLQGRDEPVYTLSETAEGFKVELPSGMTRYFGPKFLLLMDLPLPIFLPVEEDSKSGRYCFQEYVGGTGFQSCVRVSLVDSLEQGQTLPVPQLGEAILVIKERRLEAIIGPDFQAERVD